MSGSGMRAKLSVTDLGEGGSMRMGRRRAFARPAGDRLQYTDLSHTHSHTYTHTYTQTRTRTHLHTFLTSPPERARTAWRTSKPAMIAFVVAIAGMMFPAMLFTSNADCSGIVNTAARRLHAAVTNRRSTGSSLENWEDGGDIASGRKEKW